MDDNEAPDTSPLLVFLGFFLAIFAASLGWVLGSELGWLVVDAILGFAFPPGPHP